ncbi:hypothetical protein MNBD_GAMMA12-2986 [hydrothermal vent metagenome]|uniref:BON domain-containing protein n=1 Tax=hydrothermal vent metagenome TaxID=652676 RepID=A0A3B0Y6G2_9ZZZZ
MESLSNRVYKLTWQNKKIVGPLVSVCTLLLVSVLLSGCVTYGLGVGLGSHGHSSVGISTSFRPRHKHASQAKRADRQTRKEVSRILSGYRLNTRQIRVKVSRGRVTLRGTVHSYALERDIIKRIARLPGIHTVRSKMHVRYARQ